MENKSLTLSRLLALVAYIERFPGITVEELADHFGRSEKLIRADIAVLDEAGFGDALPDKTFFLDMDRYLTLDELQVDSHLQVKSAPRLTAQEAAMLVVGLAALASHPGVAEQGAPQLVAKILALAGREARDVGYRVRVIESNASEAARQVINQAIRTKRQLRVRYLSAAERETTRTVDPQRLTRVDDGWLLDAWCHEADEPRTFRLDRMLNCEPLPTPQQPGRPRRRRTPTECMVLLGPASQWRHQETSSTRTQRVPEGFKVAFPVWDEEWLTSQLLALSPDVLAVSPPGFGRAAAERARAARRVWRNLPATTDQ